MIYFASWGNNCGTKINKPPIRGRPPLVQVSRKMLVSRGISSMHAWNWVDFVYKAGYATPSRNRLYWFGLWKSRFRQDSIKITAKSKKFEVALLSEYQVNSVENTIIELRTNQTFYIWLIGEVWQFMKYSNVQKRNKAAKVKSGSVPPSKKVFLRCPGSSLRENTLYFLLPIRYLHIMICLVRQFKSDLSTHGHF